MIDTESASFEIADAIGNDFTYLQPPGEQRFDPVSVAVLLGLWMLSAVAEGIRDGIKETTADQTKLLLTAVGGKIRTLLPERSARYGGAASQHRSTGGACDPSPGRDRADYHLAQSLCRWRK